MDNIKEIPYGVADFVVMREQNLYYVDKTMYLEELERQSRFVFFIGPRLFENTPEMPRYASYKTYGKVSATVAVDVLTEKLAEIISHHLPYLLTV